MKRYWRRTSRQWISEIVSSAPELMTRDTLRLAGLGSLDQIWVFQTYRLVWRLRPVQLSLKIISPITGTAYTSPANVVITATASDNDGSIANVQFYDGGILIGNGSGTGVANQYQISFNANPGLHTLLAAATDNGGRSNASEAVP